MTIKNELAVSFSAILVLFAINLGVFFWGNAKRSESMRQVQAAASRSVILANLDRQVDDRQKEGNILAQLAADLKSAGVNQEELMQMTERLNSIGERTQALQGLADNEDRAPVDELARQFDKLRATWTEFYRAILPEQLNAEQQQQVADLAKAATDATRDTTRALQSLQSTEERRAEAATANFARVERLTNGISLSIFVTSIVVAIVVAVGFSRRLSSGLATLRGGAALLGAGTLDHQIPLGRRDELRELAESFNSMSKNLLQAQTEVLVSHEHLKAELAEAAAYVRSLLPSPLDGEVRTEWRFIPSTQLGGDAFGHEWLDHDHMALYLLDVCGHGVGAAMVSISVMNILRAKALPDVDFKNPGIVLAALNERFPMEEHGDHYFTIWYGVYQRSTRRLVYASGGHPPAVLVRNSGKKGADVAELATGGMIVGMVPGILFDTRTETLDSGARLYVFSDGVYEVPVSEGRMMSFSEFVRHLATASTQGSSTLDAALTTVRKISGRQTFDDDVSIVEVAFN